jgi:Protein of unknown function (DUF3305)
LSSTALVRICVGVLVERRKAKSPWIDFEWRPVGVLAGEPTAAPWTTVSSGKESTVFYAGAATIELHRTETANYRANVNSGAPALWVALRPTGSEPPYDVLAVTADPAEGEAFTEAGNDLVEPVPIPGVIRATLEDFISEHHVERPFFRRVRDRSGQGAQSRSASDPDASELEIKK